MATLTSSAISQTGAVRAARSRAAPGLLLVASVVGLALRLVQLEFQPLWWDEGYSVWFATESLGRMASLTALDIHPPLYYALLHGWIDVLGPTPAALRLFSAVIGALAIPLCYWSGKQLFSLRVGLVAASLLAVSPFHVYYSQEVRMYGLMALFSVTLLGVWWRVLRGSEGHAPRGSRQADTGWLVAYVILATAILYTQYYGAFLLAGLALAGLWYGWRRYSLIWRWVLAHLAIVLLYLPWVVYAAPKLVPYVSQKVVKDADNPLGLGAYLARHLSAFLAGHLEGAISPYWPWSLLLLAIAGWGFWLAWRARKGSARWTRPSSPLGMLFLGLAVSMLLAWVVGLRYPFFPDRGERLLLFAFPVFLILFSFALERVGSSHKWGGAMASIAVLAVSGLSLSFFYTTPRYAGEDYHSMIARTVEQGQAVDTVVCVYPWQVGYWRSYGSPDGPPAQLLPEAAWGPGVMSALDAALSRGHVWFPAHLALGGGLETAIETYLIERSVPFVNSWYGTSTRLSAWAPMGATEPIENAAGRFMLPGFGSGGITLESAAASLTPVEAANVTTALDLRWEAGEPPPALDVSVRLIDDLGQIWAQHDYEPLGSLGNSTEVVTDAADSSALWQATDQLAVLIPAGTPPGRYAVEVAVSQVGGAPLTAVRADDLTETPSLRLYDLDVEAATGSLAATRLPIAQRAEQEMGDGVRFLGYSASTEAATPGTLRKVSLFWTTSARPQFDYVAFLQLLAGDGTPVAAWEAAPGASFPTSRWSAGTLMRTQAGLRIPAGLADGRYRMIAGLYHPADGQRLLTAGGKGYLDLGRLEVRGRSHRMESPSPDHATTVIFGGLAALVGFDAEWPGQTLHAGDALPIQLYWHVLEGTDRSYTVFLHLVDANGVVYGYGDADPGGGEYPTTGWIAGEFIADKHEVIVSTGTPAGTYRMLVGLYDPVTGERLTMADGASEYQLDLAIDVR